MVEAMRGKNMFKLCHICKKPTKCVCRNCRKPTCKAHIVSGFIAPTSICDKCEDEAFSAYLDGGSGL